MSGAALSRQLRTGTSATLRSRRRVAGLSLFSIGMMGMISLYQTGIIKRLPDLPLARTDANAVDAAPEAYEILSMPDAVLGLGSYAATLALAAMGSDGRAHHRPWIPLALGGKTLLDSVAAAKLTVDQWTKQRAFCIWCLLSAGATFATVPLSLPEAREAFKSLKSG